MMQNISTQIQEKFGSKILATHDFRGDRTVIIQKDSLVEIMRFLKETSEFDFNILMDLSAVDYLTFPSPNPLPKGEREEQTGHSLGPGGGEGGLVERRSAAGSSRPEPFARGQGEGGHPRFEVVYHLYSLSKNHRLRLKVPLEEKDATLPSVVAFWPAADWYEREVWDMFGIRFNAHPNLKRILMYEEFVGHPLRKDYPVNKRQPLIGPKN